MGNNNSNNNLPIKSKIGKVRRSILENEELKNGIISEINSIREIHQVPKLISSNDLDSIAQSYSNKLSKKEGELEFSNNKYKGKELGEINFYNEFGVVETEVVIENWYSNEKFFEYNAKNQEATPFSQLVWKNSKLIGIGLSKDDKGGTYIVANFYPAGNVVDQFHLNVFRPKKDIKKKNNKNNEEFSKFELDALNLHNKYRSKHHSPPLILNKDLCDIAQNYAEKLLQNSNKEALYSFGKYKGNDMGENIFEYNDKEVTAEMAINEWYNESKIYDFKKDFQNGTEHFTQIIWKNTKEVGFGLSSKENKSFIVANYYPPGNFLGQYNLNVLNT